MGGSGGTIPSPKPGDPHGPSPRSPGVGGEELALGSGVGQQLGKRHSGCFGLYFGLVYECEIRPGKRKSETSQGRVTAACEGGSGHKEERGAGNSLLDTDKSSGVLQKSRDTNTELLPSTGTMVPGSGTLGTARTDHTLPTLVLHQNSVASPGAEGSGSSRGARWWEKGLGAAPECLILARGNLGTRGVFSSPDPGVKVLPSSQPQERHWASFCFSLENPLYSFHVA